MRSEIDNIKSEMEKAREDDVLQEMKALDAKVSKQVHELTTAGG